MNQDDQPLYQITIAGAIDPDWSDWLGALTVRRKTLPGGKSQTVLAGPIPDQAALRGILTALWDLNLEIVAVKRVRG